MDWDGNFQCNGLIDVAALKRRVHERSDADWNEDRHRQTTFSVHRQTQTIPLLYNADFRHTNPTPQPKLPAFEAELELIFEYLSAVYGPGGNAIRRLLTRLGAGRRIPLHRDTGFSLECSHRVHVPIVTNDSVFLTVGSEEVPMKEGEVWEINNTRAHAVRNDGDAARVHLVDDWAPAMTARQGVIVRTGADAILSK